MQGTQSSSNIFLKFTDRELRSRSKSTLFRNLLPEGVWLTAYQELRAQANRKVPLYITNYEYLSWIHYKGLLSHPMINVFTSSLVCTKIIVRSYNMCHICNHWYDGRYFPEPLFVSDRTFKSRYKNLRQCL